MNPLQFDQSTARKVCGDAMIRSIESKARKDAETGKYDPPSVEGVTYWEAAQMQMQAVVYREQYGKRLARIERKRNA